MGSKGKFAVTVNGVRTELRHPDFSKAVRQWNEDRDHSEVVQLDWPDPVTGQQSIVRRYTYEECLATYERDRRICGIS